MKIDAEKLTKLRRSKYWSQEELAVAAGLNLRTIQRIEKDGMASLQSRKGLASAFDIEVSDLDCVEKPKVVKFEYRIKKYGTKGGSFRKSEIDLEKAESEFNEMGEEGWELVTISQTHYDGGMTSWVMATFKRPKM